MSTQLSQTFFVWTSQHNNEKKKTLKINFLYIATQNCHKSAPISSRSRITFPNPSSLPRLRPYLCPQSPDLPPPAVVGREVSSEVLVLSAVLGRDDSWTARTNSTISRRKRVHFCDFTHATDRWYYKSIKLFNKVLKTLFQFQSPCSRLYLDCRATRSLALVAWQHVSKEQHCVTT